MDVYLPIAGQSVNALFIVILGFIVGVLSGMFGVGGGFLTTPLLIFYGIPPTVAVASAATQITGASVSGVLVHMRRGGLDRKMALVMIVGGLFGSLFGAILFRAFLAVGQVDLVISTLYVLILGGIGGLMLKDALVALGYIEKAEPIPAADGDSPDGPPAPEIPRSQRWVQRLPMRWRFEESGLFISPVAPLALGFAAGVLTVFLGIGGGFILVPAMIYLLGMPARIVIGTSLAMVLAVSAATTMVHALTTRAVDIVLAGLLLLGGVVGAQYGALLALRIKPDLLRLALACIILIVALRMALGLAWRPDEIFSIEYL
ncbi:MAG: sulfite exporter TauE/SafE family protein [Sphingomicrobium sp.]